MAETCGTCGKPENFPEDSGSELRPYGPGGAWICYRCPFATPKAEAETEANFEAVMEASIAATGTFVIEARTTDGGDQP